MVEEKSLKITGANKTFFTKLGNTINKILIPTKVGINGLLISAKRNSLLKNYEKFTKENYEIEYILLDVALAANAEKKVPDEWINKEGNGVLKGFIDYALPLIQGEANQPKVNGLPRFAHLKKVLVK